LEHASNGEQRQAESLPDGGGGADQAKSRPVAAAAPPTSSNRSGSPPASLARRRLPIGAKEQIPLLPFHMPCLLFFQGTTSHGFPFFDFFISFAPISNLGQTHDAVSPKPQNPSHLFSSK
jgi:hypothetical protein